MSWAFLERANLRNKDNSFLTGLLREAREKPERMPYEAAAIDRLIRRIESEEENEDV
jgi:hypothetical protein